VEKNSLKINKISSTVFEKKKKDVKNWTSKKMGNAKKGHNETGCAKVVLP